MQRQRLIFLAAGIILLVGALFMVNVYLERERQAIKQQEARKIQQVQRSQTQVLVAKKDIPRGAGIDASSVELKVFPNQFVQPQAVTSLDRIAGMLTIAPIAKDEQITLSKLTYPKQASGLAEVTPVGKRAITISVDNIASLAGMIKSGDYVDVIAMINIPVQGSDGKTTTQGAVIPLFQNVLVLAVGQEIGAVVAEAGRYKKEEKKEPSPLITLALSPEEASLIAFVMEQGRIRLTLRSPSDSQIRPIQPASWDALFRYIMPQQEGASDVKHELPPEEYVEIYRGTSKEKVILNP